MEPNAPLNLMILGKKQAGKSSSANTILGQEAFDLKNRVTSECSERHATVSGRLVSVVDTPGLFDTQMTHEEIMMEIAKSVYLSSPGPHAFLIVFPVNMRFTEHEQQIPQIIEIMFGQEVLKYSIILFTHGDLLKQNNIEDLINGNIKLRHLVQQCGGRFHVFNNEDANNREQNIGLLQKIDTMIEQNYGYYSNQMYEDAYRFRQLEEERRRVNIKLCYFLSITFCFCSVIHLLSFNNINLKITYHLSYMNETFFNCIILLICLGENVSIL
uniref:AIG1-type G domain-containing protein n=1 Tax=Cyprinus carpio TaxID=7962 RepID=A0A8C1P4S1_CYPCA